MATSETLVFLIYSPSIDNLSTDLLKIPLRPHTGSAGTLVILIYLPSMGPLSTDQMNKTMGMTEENN